MTTLKYSRQRMAIMDSLRSRKDHPTADMIFSDLRETHPNISLGTVYRNLALLSERGEILRISTPNGADHYDGCITPHNHLVCRSCGSVLDLDSDESTRRKLIQKASSAFEGSIEDCSILFTGLCPSCRTTEEKR